METAVWSALADPNRRAILALLLKGPRPVGELAESCGLSQPSASKHLRVLRDAGLVRVERDAQRRLYAIEPAPMAGLDAWLTPYRRLWNSSLDALGRRLDAGHAPAPEAAEAPETQPAQGAAEVGEAQRIRQERAARQAGEPARQADEPARQADEVERPNEAQDAQEERDQASRRAAPAPRTPHPRKGADPSWPL
jgi:DNA-binding transcriptional ArsR family regulator